MSTIDKGWIRFEIRDGMRRVSCAVSDEALDAVSGITDGSTPGLRRRSFDRFRTLIHAAALIRLEMRPRECVDPILITSQDLQRVPPQTGTPKFGSSNWSPAVPVLEGPIAVLAEGHAMVEPSRSNAALASAAHERPRNDPTRDRHAAGVATSPPAVEATLASISDEVMEEAIARRNAAPAPKSPKGG